MKPQDIVAIILAAGACSVFLSTSFLIATSEPGQGTKEGIVALKDIMNVIIGGLLAYIVSKKVGDK